MADLDLLPGVQDLTMRIRSQQKVYVVTLRFPKEVTRDVRVKASSREVAERRAIKRNPGALGVKRSS